MKSLKDYITESFRQNDSTAEFKNLKVTYAGPVELKVQIPVSYGDDDLQIYLDDTMMDKMPGGKESESTKLFGDNVNNIIDAHFEITEIEYTEDNSSTVPDVIPWDKSYAPKSNTEDMKTAVIKNILYIIEFSKFDLSGVTEQTYKETLEEIFENTVSDSYKYPISISFNKENMSYI